MLNYPVSQTDQRKYDILGKKITSAARQLTDTKIDKGTTRRLLGTITFYSLESLNILKYLKHPEANIWKMEEFDKELSCSHDQHESQLLQQNFDAACALQCRHIRVQRQLLLTDTRSGLACISSEAEAIKLCKPLHKFTQQKLSGGFGHCFRLSENRWKHDVFSQVSFPHYCHRWCSLIFEE